VEGDLPKNGEPLETGREAYGDLELVRIKAKTWFTGFGTPVGGRV